ncbi:MAG: IS110 family transposase [Rhodospirillales bacterium]|nr:IS110 family transposase [Rhodospirillales bacterium]
MQDGVTKMDTTIAVAGIDVSKAKLDVVMPDGGAFVVPRDGRGLAALRGRCREAGVTDIALEASGGYEQEVLDGLADGDWRIHLLNPRRVRRFAEAAGVLAKTDPIDARVIALFTRHFPEAGVVRRPPGARRLAEFLRVRAMLRKAVDDARNQLEHLREPALRELVLAHRAGLEGRLKALDADIAAAIEADGECRRKASLMRSMCGVGPVLAASVLAVLPELGSLTRRQAAHLAGTAPADRRSGAGRARATVRGGRDGLVEVLHMAALNAMRFNPDIKAFAERLRADGKPFQLVCMACARKIVVTLNAMIRDDIPWTPRLAA